MELQQGGLSLTVLFYVLKLKYKKRKDTLEVSYDLSGEI